LRESGVGLDHAQERHVGDRRVPYRADKHATKRRSRLGGFKKPAVHTAVVDQLPKAILSLNRVPRCALTKRLCDADIRDLAEQQVRRDLRDVARHRHVKHHAAFLAHLSCPETTMRTATNEACVDVGNLLRVAGVPSAPLCVFVIDRLPLFGRPSDASTFRKCHLRRSFQTKQPPEGGRSYPSPCRERSANPLAHRRLHVRVLAYLLTSNSDP